MSDFINIVASRLNLPSKSVKAVLDLLSEGATIPFIARYRKDATGAMDEVQIQQIQEANKVAQEFSDRLNFITKTISEQGKMTDAIQEKLQAATVISELEDIYLPYKPKRKTKAQAAKERGLEPLALLIIDQNKQTDINAEAEKYITEEVADAAAALQGARDIIAETINEDAELRARLRTFFEKNALVSSTVLPEKEQEGNKFKDYFDFSESVRTIPSHRMLAVMRGFMEGFLKLSIGPDEEQALEMVENAYVKGDSPAAAQVKKAARDAYKRLLHPSLESEMRLSLKLKADEEAINVFSENLRQLLLSSPLGSKKTLAIDPGYKTGCKVVVLSQSGDLLENDLIYVHEKNHKLIEAEQKITSFCQKFDIEAIAIGDGTAGRETEQFIKRLKLGIPVFLVNEDGASVYSASETARAEFPDQDVTVRGAVSIGRRLMDPLAELVKIDPKSIGVGQYQHDVNQSRLKEKLDQTVESCVNAVGVNLNTAGKHLLHYVSGIGLTLSENIVQYRKEHGQFKNRKDLLKVPRLGGKAFEQSAGFLRISNADNPLDASGVHPEAYDIVEKIAKDAGVHVQELMGNEELLKSVNIKKYLSETVGLHTLEDIMKELRKPGLDPRPLLEEFEYAEIFSIEEVREGMIVPGIVTNLTRFGAFVDIGVKQDGLVHVSEIAHKYVSDPAEVLKLNDKVQVMVTQVDVARKRIALSIKQATAPSPQKDKPKKTQPNKGSMADALSALKGKFGK